eukprot:281720_1
MRIISFSIFLLGIAVAVPSCNWVLTQSFGIQPTDICLTGGWQGIYDTMYKCDNGVVKYNFYTLNSGCTETPSVEGGTFTTDLDCSQSTCTDYVIYPWYYDENDCTSFSHETILPNVCLDIDPNGDHSYVKYQVYDDSNENPNFNVETIIYNDAECTDIERCHTMSGVPSANAACGQPPIISYTGTPDSEMFSCDGGGGGSGTTCSQNQTPSCNWVQSDHFGVQVIDVCIEGGYSGQSDVMFTCATDPNNNNAPIVLLNTYALSSGCSGTSSAIGVVSDISQFGCSQSTCTDYVIWPWYFDENDCSSYSIQASIPNICVCQGESFQKVQVYDDSSQNPSFNMEVFDYGNDETCQQLGNYYTMSDVPSANEACSAPPILSYTGTPNTQKTDTNGGGGGFDPDGTYDIDININCNWVYYDEWIRVIGICDTMKPDDENPDMEIDSQIVCNSTHVSRKYYDSYDGSCSGSVVHISEYTDNPTLFDCSMATCGENNYIKFRRYDSCNISFAGFTTYNMVTNQCFHDFEDNTDYFVTCDSGGFRHGYDTGDARCGALTVTMEHYTDLNEECVAEGNDEEASFEVLDCYGSKSPTTAPSVSTSAPSTSAPSAPTLPTTSVIVTDTGGVNRISDYIFSIIMVVAIYAFIN